MTFSSAKPGSGASTLAAQTAFALRRATSQRVLLADFDLMGGMIGFYLKLSNTKSLLDALQSADQLTDAVWPSFVATSDGVDILPAPDTPYVGAVDAARLHAVLEHARANYDWVVIDLPVVFQRLSLLDDLRVRPGLSGFHRRVAQPALGPKSSEPAGATGVSQGTLSGDDQPRSTGATRSPRRTSTGCSIAPSTRVFRTIIFPCIGRLRWASLSTATASSARPWMAWRDVWPVPDEGTTKPPA